MREGLCAMAQHAGDDGHGGQKVQKSGKIEQNSDLGFAGMVLRIKDRSPMSGETALKTGESR
jgi:hypothetical protein